MGKDSMAHPGSGEMFKGPVEGTGWEGQEMRRLELRQECQLYPVENGAPEQVFWQEQTRPDKNSFSREQRPWLNSTGEMFSYPLC